MTDPRPFDLCGPLPGPGTTLLEASAGTGKTFTIAGLCARYIAEGVPIEKLLVVTFTRSATSELRERVRARLVDTAASLAGDEGPKDDEVAALLARGSPEEVALRRRRLAAAVTDFDAATIDTTHGFCLHVLSGLGVAGDVEPDVSLVEDVSDLLQEVVDDLYVRKFARWPSAPPLTRAQAIEVGRVVLANPGAALVPEPGDDNTTPAMRRRLAERLVDEMNRRKRMAGILTYDDILTRLCATLRHEQRGRTACQRLRQRYDIALIDEFQDTDPVQWEIVRRAFAETGATLVLIGDPKQAIYAFRGADVHAYLDAVNLASTRATLRTNWRSDQALIDAMDRLFGGAQLGHPGIAYRTVEAAEAHRDVGLLGAPDPAPMRVRVLDCGSFEKTRYNNPSPGPVRDAVARDVASEAVALLRSGATLRDARLGGWRAVEPADLAVLVGTNAQAGLVRDALVAVGVPAVVGGTSSVFGTSAGRDWLWLLEALDQPTSRTRAAAAALSDFVGWTAEQVATAAEADWEDLHQRLHVWSALFRRRGVAPLWENVTVTQHLPARLLTRAAGERPLTDLRHVGELLHAAAAAETLGLNALIGWLRARVEEAERVVNDETRNRRLESDAAAVQVLTIHRSKGLEFPVVFCPYAWDSPTPTITVPVFHDEGRRTIDVGGEGWPGFHDHKERDLAEQRGEDLRLLYVALTRARHQVVVWWAGTAWSKQSALGRLLFPGASGEVPDRLRDIPREADVVARVQEVGGSASMWDPDAVTPARFDYREPASGPLAVATFDRSLDTTWRRVSYSAITALAHEATVASEPEAGAAGVAGDERTSGAGGEMAPTAEVSPTADEVAPAAPGTATAGEVEVLLGAMPGGVEVGTAIHHVLEATDFAAPDLDEALRRALEDELARRDLDLGDLDRVTAGLRSVIEAPVFGDVALRAIGRSDRLDEMSFELPLVGGDHPSGDLSIGDVAEVLSQVAAPDDPVATYRSRLEDPALTRALRGFLTGSLDLVVRLPGPRFAVADYKTNRLADGGAGPLTAWHYRPDALDAEMRRAHYPLQALLYVVALHRYLRWRIAGYDPVRHLAGVRYLFVRGMSDPGGSGAGVWAWDPSPRLVEALSDLFDRGRP